MSKNNQEIDRGELKSVAPKNTVTKIVSKPTPKNEVEEPSLFSNILEGDEKAEKMEETIKAQYATIPKKPVIKEEDIEETPQPVVKIEEPLVCKVYEITCMTVNMAGEKKEAIVYSYHIPTVVQDTPELMVIQAPFGKHNFREVVFGKKLIEVSCREEVEEQQLVADITNGILIKFIPEEDWMNRDYEQTKDMFEKAVLNAYRNISQTIVPPKQQAPLNNSNSKPKQKVVYHNGQPGQDDFEDIRTGNIPVNRPAIWPTRPGEGMEIIPG